MSDQVQTYTVALGRDGRVATLTIPTPWSTEDLERVRAWVGYMKDVERGAEVAFPRQPTNTKKPPKPKTRRPRPPPQDLVMEEEPIEAPEECAPEDESASTNGHSAENEESLFDVRASPGAIRALLADGPLGAHALSKRLGFGTTSNSVRAALERMIEHGDVDEQAGAGTRGVTLYALTEEGGAS